MVAKGGVSGGKIVEKKVRKALTTSLIIVYNYLHKKWL